MVHCEGKCPSCTSEGDDRLSKTNDTKFEFIAKEEEDRDFCVYLIFIAIENSYNLNYVYNIMWTI